MTLSATLICTDTTCSRRRYDIPPIGDVDGYGYGVHTMTPPGLVISDVDIYRHHNHTTTRPRRGRCRGCLSAALPWRSHGGHLSHLAWIIMTGKQTPLSVYRIKNDEAALVSSSGREPVRVSSPRDKKDASGRTKIVMYSRR